MENNIKSNTTFWTEINSYKIQVPYYQRDYAQGRTDGGRIDNIRKVFVEELYKAIKGERLCHLGLVFGSYDIDNSTFIAVDGQQRLTTVFLLYWYVAWRENKLSDYQKLSTNFSWDTRSYSSQFVELLFKINRIDNVIDAIKTNCNYFSIWENDPTVKGMLTMLEEIEKQYPKDECGLCQKLFSGDCSIKYDILKLEKNSDGKTYLKMNSRGRSLTTFELFKSKFIDECKNTNKFDGTWLNFMLEMSKDDNGNFADPDISYMNFINEYTYMILSLHSNDDSDKEYKHFIDAKMKDNLTDVPFISFEKYKPAFENINSFEKFFDWICTNYEKIKCIDGELRFPDSKFFADEIIKSSNPHFSHRAKFFSLFKYAELTGYVDVEKKLYKRWNRVFRNLVANTEIDGNNFGKICKTINQIANADIYLYLANGGKLNTFDNGQIEEEIAKAKQILNDNGELREYKGEHKKMDNSNYTTWEEIIIETESYAFFKGAIRFLFTKEKIGDDWDNFFDTKWTNAQKYFDENGVKETYKVELTKALVIQCDDWANQLCDKQIFNPKSSTWEWILTAKNWQNPIHNLLVVSSLVNIAPINTNNDKNIEKYITPILNNLPYKEMIETVPDGRFRCYKGRLGFYIRQSKAIIFDWDTWKRNELLHKLLQNHGALIKINSEHKISGVDLFWGWDINFEYSSYCFQWWRNYDNQNCDIYLMENDWNGYKNRPNPTSDKGTDEDKYYCFRVTKDMESDTSQFINGLNKLIEKLQIS